MTDDCASAYLQGFKSMCCDGEGHLSWRAIAANGMKVSFAPLKAPTPGHAEKCQVRRPQEEAFFLCGLGCLLPSALLRQ